MHCGLGRFILSATAHAILHSVTGVDVQWRAVLRMASHKPLFVTAADRWSWPG